MQDPRTSPMSSETFKENVEKLTRCFSAIPILQHLLMPILRIAPVGKIAFEKDEARSLITAM